MNPNYNPSTVAAAEREVAQQALDASRDIELKRNLGRANIADSPAVLERTFAALESIGGRAPAILSETVKVRSTNGKILTLASEDGRISIDVLRRDPDSFTVNGDSFHLELRPVISTTAPEVAEGFGYDARNAGRGPDIPHRGMHNLATGELKNPVSEVKPAPPITGTTGSQGTNDTAARASVAEGGPVNPEDPNATGPSTDAGQATKGEMVQGMQTGGTSGKGTGKGESERAAARIAGNSEAQSKSK